jgi:hypothetical protein
MGTVLMSKFASWRCIRDRRAAVIMKALCCIVGGVFDSNVDALGRL